MGHYWRQIRAIVLNANRYAAGMQPDPMESLTSWEGSLGRFPRPAATLSLRAPIRRAKSSGAGAFLGVASDNRLYWLKVPGNHQGDQVLVNEAIVQGVGRLLGAPVRERALIRVDPMIASAWDDYPARPSSSPVIAHGSLHVEGAVDDDRLKYTRSGDNPERQARLLGLWDFCVGEDPQWLFETGASYATWSYDHGLWFTTGEGDWDAQVLEQIIDVDASWQSPPPGLSKTAIVAMAGKISALTPDELLGVMSAVPLEWGTGDRDLESMAWFLYRRRDAVAARLQQLAHRLPGRDERIDQ